MRPAKARWGDVAVATVATLAVGSLAALTLASVYGTAGFAVASAAALASGVGIAVLAERLRLGRAVTVLVAVAGYAAGATLTATSASSLEADSLAPLLREVLRGPILGWKGMVTLPTPLGDYQGVMIPAYALLFAGACGAVSAALRTRRWWWGPVIAAATYVAAIVLGPAVRGASPGLLGLTVPREALYGLAAFAALLAWFVAHASLDRRRVRHTVGEASGAPLRRTLAGLGSGTLMAVIAVAGAALVLGMLPTSARDVARTAVAASTTIAAAETPLSTYRLFTRDEAYEAPLFTVEGDPVDRVRLAVLPAFDGEQFGVGGGDDASAVVFRRLPSGVGVASDAAEVELAVSIQGLTGIWAPLAGSLDSVQFGGPRAAALTDTFYYVPDRGSGVVAVDGGLAPGDVIRVSAGVSPPGYLGGAAGQAGPTVDPALLPVAMLTWIEDQGLGRDGAALLELIDRLRARGYVSHALVASPDGTYAWQRALGDHPFASSAAGGSVARVGALFDQLNARAAEAGDASDALLVAAVGDDEQFAAASALLAAALGFEARVVVGTRLVETDPHGWTPPVCEEGRCAGKNVSAWIEVRTDGGWAPIDTSPQTELPLAPEVVQNPDPAFGTDLHDERADVVAPPSSQRSRSGEDDATDMTPDLDGAPLAPAVRIAVASSLGLIALLLPFAVLLAWKRARRVRRRRGAPGRAITGGWEQYLDDAADAGLAHVGARTRAEVADLYGSPHGAAIAALADRATFSHSGVAAGDAVVMWRMVRDDRRHWRGQRGPWRRLTMALSPRSLARGARRAEPGAGDAPQRAATWRNDRATSARRGSASTWAASRSTR